MQGRRKAGEIGSFSWLFSELFNNRRSILQIAPKLAKKVAQNDFAPSPTFQMVATPLVKCLFWSTFQNASNGVSKSVLLYEPTIEDDGRYLTCRAENAALRNTALEDQWTIQVHCKQLYCFYKGKSFKLIRCIADFDATLYTTCVWYSVINYLIWLQLAKHNLARAKKYHILISHFAKLLKLAKVGNTAS